MLSGSSSEYSLPVGFSRDDLSRIACILRASNCPIGPGILSFSLCVCVSLFLFLDSVTRHMKQPCVVGGFGITEIFLYDPGIRGDGSRQFSAIRLRDFSIPSPYSI